MRRSIRATATFFLGMFVAAAVQPVAAQERAGLFDGVGAPPPPSVAADERAYARAAAAILADPAKRSDPAYNPFAANPDCFDVTSVQCNNELEALANDPRKSLSCRLGLLCADPPAIPGYTPYKNTSQHVDRSSASRHGAKTRRSLARLTKPSHG